MSLGQNIYRLRTAREMSQLELAELLGVSRQSISKWETDASVPELEKLIKLSELFGVTLDDLVAAGRGDTDAPSEPTVGRDDTGTPPESKPEPQYIYVSSRRSARKIVGTILLCMGFLVVLLLSILGAFAGGLIFASPFIGCGIICLCSKRLPGLWCAWAILLLVSLYLQYATGVTWTWVLNSFLWKSSGLNVQMIISAVLLAALAALILITAYCLRSPHIDLRTNWKKPLIIALVLIVLRLALYFVTRELYLTLISAASYFATTLLNTLDLLLRTAIAVALLTLASRCIKWKK